VDISTDPLPSNAELGHHVRPERNGYIYVLDRSTGEVLSAKPFVHITSSTRVDLKTGQPMGADARKPQIGRVV
jgi:glucose dehydrogenase